MTVVGLVAEGEDPWVLPAATRVDQRWVTGGLRELYLVLVAAAAAGEEAELRGPVVVSEIEAICAQTGARVALPETARQVREDDVVVVLCGQPDPRFYARRMLAPGRTAIMVLSATGLFGWPFAAGWERRDPLDVDPAEVGRPEHLAAMDALGFTVWTNNPHVVRQGAATGVVAHDVKSGLPTPPPTVPSKTVDVVVVTDNRWWPLTERAVASLDGAVTVDRVPSLTRDELQGRLGAGRIFLHMAAIEGHSTLGEEARLHGTVPIGLASNRFGVGFREDEGGLAVERPEDAGAVVRALLGNPERLARLADAGRRKAVDELRWEPFVAKLRAALDALPDDDPARPARGEIGRMLADERLGLLGLANEAQARWEELRGRRSVGVALNLARGAAAIRGRITRR
jgi:hypothetical protein